MMMISHSETLAQADDRYRWNRIIEPNWYALIIAVLTGCSSNKALNYMGILPDTDLTRFWTEERKDELVKLVDEEHVSFDEIGQAYGILGDTVRTKYTVIRRERGLGWVDGRTKAARAAREMRL